MSDPSAAPPARNVTLVLTTRDGRILGKLPPFEAETPWWQDARPIVNGARKQFDLQVTVLRMLEAERPSAHGGAVTYLVEVDEATASSAAASLAPWSGHIGPDPLRQSWAEPGGPDADLAWADAVLASHGLQPRGAAEQDRTWNLSSLWRVPLVSGAAWLKVVPPFFAHEGAILERLADEAVPDLLGHYGQRMLMLEIPGDDRYDAPLPELLAMVDLLVRLQSRWLGRVDELRAMGLPDWTEEALAQAIKDVIEGVSRDLPAVDQAALVAFVDRLPERVEAIRLCGLGDSLVHGDFHPGNVRGDANRLVLLDWGDSGIGHPLLDQPAFLTRIPERAVTPVRDHWRAAWRRAVPGSDPEHAADLLAPLAAARQAVIYQRFLDNIEASEQPYHRADVPDWLHRTAELLRAEALAAGGADPPAD